MRGGRLQGGFCRPDADSREVLRLCVPAGLLAVVAILLAVRLPLDYGTFLENNPALGLPLASERVPGLLNIVSIFSGFCGAWLLAAFLTGFSRKRTALSMLRKGYLSVAAGFLVYAYAVLTATGVIFDRSLPVGGVKADSVLLFYWRWHLLWPALAALTVAALGYVWAWRRAASRVFGGDPERGPAAGDLVLENLRTHGRDPRFRKSMLHSATLHLLVIVILPFLLQFLGCVEPYRVPKGSGNPVVALVKVIPPKPKKERKKKYIVNPNSAISFLIPHLDDSMLMQKVDEDTQVTYQADPNRVFNALGTAQAGKMGAGGGKTGGWPDGMENAKVRFIRMEYNGPGWDDGMDPVKRADLNFLDTFHKLTGFKVATTPESHPVRLLKKYPKGYAPPFVYMTGDGGINVPAGEIRIMRDYLNNGGMLFADCGSPRWDRSFRGFVQQLFPGESLLVIADDDPLFQVPYAFPNGAPPLWHHGGNRALGIKHTGRWVLFYHPGDINDAWKTGHSGLDPKLAEGATQMGVNIVYYAFTHYLELTKKYR
ncbi:MAG: DUF4159 domain-containing protein [Lentisphaerae bacterium]|nr:DUF4159 domain-containing protein [Lentisphaerota bacterium]